VAAQRSRAAAQGEDERELRTPHLLHGQQREDLHRIAYYIIAFLVSPPPTASHKPQQPHKHTHKPLDARR